MEKIKFGTSGFRGIYGDTFTKINVQKIVTAVALYFLENKKNDKPINICIGFDNRFMGREFAEFAVSAMLACNTKITFYDKPTPSPLVCFESKYCDVGIHITASHNMFYYNGIKIFEGGHEISNAGMDRIAKLANSPLRIAEVPLEVGLQEKRLILSQDISHYCDSLLKLVNIKAITKHAPKILFNAMHGSSLECFEYLMKKLKLKNYVVMNGNIDPYFEHKIAAPYVTNIDGQIKRMKSENFDIGIALDGDGDRFTLVDKNGTPYDCNYVSAIIIDYLAECENYSGTVVKNCALTHLVDLVAGKHNMKAIDAKVGFKNIAEEMSKSSNAFIGIESNGVSLKKHAMQKDGLMATMLVLALVSERKKSVTEIVDGLKQELNFPCHVVEYAYPFTALQRPTLEKTLFEEKKLPKFPNKVTLVSYNDGIKIWFEGGYWAVIRFSGNENVIRFFAEMPTKRQSDKIIKIIEDFTGLKDRQ